MARSNSFEFGEEHGEDPALMIGLICWIAILPLELEDRLPWPPDGLKGH